MATRRGRRGCNRGGKEKARGVVNTTTLQKQENYKKISGNPGWYAHPMIAILVPD